tara:strand:+ start:5682 stop:5888 length:207 start_codon:yes stop_codon:yes gene_type:complete
MARNTPTEILDNIKKLLVKDIINLWDTANINNNAVSNIKSIAPSVRNFEFDIKLKLLTKIVDMEVSDG